MNSIVENRAPFTISVSSGKGGVGKSVVTANLAKAISEYLNVLVWDADTLFPNQHLLMGVEPPVRLNDVYSGKVDVSKAVFSVEANLNLLADMPAVVHNDNQHQNRFQSIYDELNTTTDFDVVIIDTPRAGTLEMMQCAGVSDMIILIITDEPTSLLDAYALVKIMLPYIEPERIKLLVNNVIDMDDAQDVSKKLNLVTENFLEVQLEYLGYIPYDRAVRLSILQQELFIKAAPEAEVTKSLKSVGENILSRLVNHVALVNKD